MTRQQLWNTQTIHITTNASRREEASDMTTYISSNKTYNQTIHLYYFPATHFLQVTPQLFTPQNIPAFYSLRFPRTPQPAFYRDPQFIVLETSNWHKHVCG